MKRREFCRQMALTGSAIALAPLINGCATDAAPAPTPANRQPPTVAAARTAAPAPTPATTAAPPPPADTPQPPPTARPTEEVVQPTAAAQGVLATVALVKTSDRALGVRQALQLLGLSPAHGSRVLLKPNYNSADPAPATTHLDTLRSLVVELNNMGARAITVGERSGMGDTRAVLAQTGVLDLGAELGFDTAIFDELQERDWVIRRPRDAHWTAGFAVPRMLLDSDCVVQTCNLKTHGYGGHFHDGAEEQRGLCGAHDGRRRGQLHE